MTKLLRILKITGLIILIGFALYLIFLKSDTNKEGIQNEEQTKTKQVVSEELVFLDEDGTYSFKDSSLIVNADLPEDVQEIAKYGDEQIDRFVSMRKEAGDLETASFPWNLDMKYQTYESDTIISYLVQGYEYTGGAHGNTFIESFNYDKKTGKRIGVMDIVSNEDSLNVFAALADKELTVEYPEGSSGIKENWSIWYSDNDSVTFIFVPYQIASYATGQQELTISIQGDNQNLFNSKYF
jgi:hypothetical protein